MTEQAVRVTVGENGRLLLPAVFRKALGLSGAGQVVLTLEGDAVRVTSVRRRLMEARDRLRRFVPARRGMVDALLEERHAEEAQEDAAPGATVDASGEAADSGERGTTAAGSGPDDPR